MLFVLQRPSSVTIPLSQRQLRMSQRDKTRYSLEMHSFHFSLLEAKHIVQIILRMECSSSW